MRYGTGVALCLAAGTIWSLMGLGLRQIDSASVWQILFWRSVGMIPVLLGFMWWTSRGRPLVALRAVGAAGVLGGLGLVLAFSGAIYAFQTTTVANAVLLQELVHFHKRRLLEQVRRRLPGTTLTDLRFRAGTWET